MTYEPNLDIKDQSVGNDLFYEFINWEQRPVKVGSQILLPTIFGMATSGPVPRTQKIMSQQSVNLLIADVGVLDPSEEIDENEGVSPGEIIDKSLTTEHW